MMLGWLPVMAGLKPGLADVWTPDWIVAIGTVVALSLSAYNIHRQRQDSINKQKAADKQAGADAYALKNLLAAWSAALSGAKESSPDIRAVVFRGIFKEVEATDQRFGRLTETALEGSSTVTEHVAAATVLYHEVSKQIRRAARNPDVDKTVDHGQVPSGMEDGSIDHMLLLLKESRRSLSNITPDEIKDARELFWPTPPNG